jgi:uncharacterized spore protein YtfJ
VDMQERMPLTERLETPIRLVVDRVVGPPIERDGATLVPVVAVRAGGGGGGGVGHDASGGAEGEGSGLGFGAMARPVGAYVLRDGEIRYEPAIDVTRIAIGGQLLVGIAILLVTRAMRRRRLNASS